MIIRIHPQHLATFPAPRRRAIERSARLEGGHMVLCGTREEIEALIGSVRIGRPPKPILRLAGRLRDVSTCTQRGDQVGEEECDSCTGRVRAKVFACAKHDRCTLFTKPIRGVRCCHGCEDFTPPAEPADPGRQA